MQDISSTTGPDVNVEAPNIRTIVGIKPRTLGDLREALEWVEKGIVKVLHATHIGNEESYVDYESKAMHVSMADHVAMEIADIAVIVVVGHNVMYARPIADYLDETGRIDEFEIAGLCCTAHDMTRYNAKAKIFGPIYYQLRVIRAGLADVIVSDEQCIRADLLDACRKVGVPLIATSGEDCRCTCQR